MRRITQRLNIEKTIFFLIILFSFSSSFSFANPNGERSALVIIDMQDYFANRGGNHNQEANKKKIDQIISTQVEMIRQARRLNLPIILVEYDCGPCGETTKKLKDAVANYPNAKFIKKNSDGMFEDYNKYKKELVDYLKEKKIGTLVITGANGGACVLSSIEGALRNDYNVIALSKGIADFNYKDFIYPYENYYNKMKPTCKNCSIREVASITEVNQALGYGNTSTNRTSTNESNGVR